MASALLTDSPGVGGALVEAVELLPGRREQRPERVDEAARADVGAAAVEGAHRHDLAVVEGAELAAEEHRGDELEVREAAVNQQAVLLGAVGQACNADGTGGRQDGIHVLLLHGCGSLGMARGATAGPGEIEDAFGLVAGRARRVRLRNGGRMLRACEQSRRVFVVVGAAVLHGSVRASQGLMRA